MNSAPTIAISVVAAVAVSFGLRAFDSDREPAPRTEGADVSVELQALSRRIAKMAEAQAAMQETVTELRMRPAGSTGERQAVGELEAAIERYLADRTQPLEAALELPEEAAAGLAGLDMQTLISMLGDDERDWLEREELWQKLREEGRLDEVIAEFERLAEMDPNNPDRKVELGYAYIQKLQEVGASALAGKWASMADEQFDAALALDEAHWDARFMKAVSLSHWPAFTGKSAEAIVQFEKLIEIQDQGPVQDNHVDTYLTLGNMYMSQGKDDLALATWQKGLGVFPTHAGLLAQISALEGK